MASQKKTENTQVRGWRVGNECGGRSQAGHCSLIAPEAGSMLRAMFGVVRGHNSATATKREQLFGQASAKRAQGDSKA